MCCTTVDHMHTRCRPAFDVQACGCGCIGRMPAKTELERRRDHLKAELKAVEQQLQALEDA